jgi:tryptophanyl-tRNA synthetase
MTQDMATYFNEAFGAGTPILRRPEWRLSKTPYVPGVDGRKMSKSYDNSLPMFLAGKPLWAQIAGIKTDSTELGQPLPWKTDNVFALLELFCDEEQLAELRGYYESGSRGGQAFGYGHAKKLLQAKIEEHFAPARARREHFLAHPDEVEDVLRESAKTARVLAEATMDACRRACGLR